MSLVSGAGRGAPASEPAGGSGGRSPPVTRRCSPLPSGRQRGAVGAHERAQYFGDAPGLRDAAARRERLLGVEDFADRADARVVQVVRQRLEQTSSATRRPRDGRASHASTKGPIEPCPDRALVIGGVAGAQVAEISRLVVRMIRRERPQTRRASGAGSRPRQAPAPTSRDRAPGAAARCATI